MDSFKQISNVFILNFILWKILNIYKNKGEVYKELPLY